MPALIAAPWLGTAIAGIAGGTGAIVGAKMQSGAATKAANLETGALNHAADVKAQSDADTLAWQKQQADNTAKQAEIDRRANYDQWYAQQNERNTVRAALGYPTAPIPAYVPGLTPNFTGASNGAPANVATRDPNQLAPGWTQNPDGTFRFAPNGGSSPSGGPTVPTPASAARSVQPQAGGPQGPSAPPATAGPSAATDPYALSPPAARPGMTAPNYLPMPGQPGYQPYSINSYLGAR